MGAGYNVNIGAGINFGYGVTILKILKLVRYIWAIIGGHTLLVVYNLAHIITDQMERICLSTRLTMEKHYIRAGKLH